MPGTLAGSSVCKIPNSSKTELKLFRSATRVENTTRRRLNKGDKEKAESSGRFHIAESCSKIIKANEKVPLSCMINKNKRKRSGMPLS